MASAVVCLKKKHTHGSDFHEVNPLTLEKFHYLNKLIISYIFGVDLCQICYNSQTPHQHEIPTASQVSSTRHAKLSIYIIIYIYYINIKHTYFGSYFQNHQNNLKHQASPTTKPPNQHHVPLTIPVSWKDVKLMSFAPRLYKEPTISKWGGLFMLP